MSRKVYVKKPNKSFRNPGHTEAKEMINFTRRLLNVSKSEVDTLRKKRDSKKR